MQVHLGNDHAVEGYPDPATGETKFRPVPGQRVTTFDIPDGLSIMDKVGVVTGSLSHLMEAGTSPAWVEADDENVRVLICSVLGVDPNEQRPGDWGKDTEEN